MKNDTNKKIAKIFNDMIKEKSHEQRLKMGFSMFESSRKIILSTIKDHKNWRVTLFKKFYKNDFDEKTKDKIINSIKDNEKKC